MDESTRPAHHMELLGALDFATEIATLYGHVAALAADMCRSCGIPDAEAVIAVVQEQARLAKAAGIGVKVLTNGFSTEAAIAKLAPYVTGAKIGLKGSGDPEFYRVHMRSEGAMETVRASILAWQARSVRVSVSDTIAALHLQTDERAEAYQYRTYAWVAEHLGPHALLHIGEMHTYNRELNSHDPLLSVKAGPDAAERHKARTERALQIAREVGLVYAEGTDSRNVVACHACGGVLVRSRWLRSEGAVAVYQPHVQFVMADGRCEHCGAQTPVRVLSVERLAEIRQRWRDDPPPNATVRIEEE
jgi:pyruvate-formate lyase-activating enzyme